MQTQQLRYLIAAADHGSFRAASQSMYVSQSSISVAVKDLEQELGVTLFERTSRGIGLTPEGVEIVERARSVVEQIEAMESLYSRVAKDAEGPRFAVSSQHYSLVVDAFGDFVEALTGQAGELALRESYTNEIIRDVQEGRSDLGIIYLSNYNDRAINRSLSDAGLTFESLYVARPHAIVRSGHPLAGREALEIEELAAFPRIQQEQSIESSSYFAEEPLASAPSLGRLLVSDNGTLSTMLERTDAYALGTGAFPDEGKRFISVPILTDETMDVGCIRKASAVENPLASEFLRALAKRIATFDGPIEASPLVGKLIREGE